MGHSTRPEVPTRRVKVARLVENGADWPACHPIRVGFGQLSPAATAGSLHSRGQAREVRLRGWRHDDLGAAGAGAGP